jgi:hypothetical protein
MNKKNEIKVIKNDSNKEDYTFVSDTFEIIQKIKNLYIMKLILLANQVIELKKNSFKENIDNKGRRF